MANASKAILNLDGFDEMLERIKKAGADLPKVAKKAAEAGADTYHAILFDKCKSAGVPDDLLDEIQETIEADASGERITCTVGWKLPTYDPTNPAAGYKVIFMNYGTVRRNVLTNKRMRVLIDGQWKTLSARTKNRGQLPPKGFIAAAKKAAKTKVKKAQAIVLETVARDLGI